MERLESSDLGRACISAFLVVVLISLVAYAAPDSAPQRTLLRPATPLLVATGLGQGWGVFAPNPRRELIDVVAEVHNAGGRVDRWRFPLAGPFAANRDYRWRKLMEWNFMDPAIIKLTALYAERQSHDAGRRPQRVVVLRRIARLGPPGDDRPPVWKTQRAELALSPETFR